VPDARTALSQERRRAPQRSRDNSPNSGYETLSSFGDYTPFVSRSQRLCALVGSPKRGVPIAFYASGTSAATLGPSRSRADACDERGVGVSVQQARDLEPFDKFLGLTQVLAESLELSEVLDRVAYAATGLVPQAAARIWVADSDYLVLRSEAGIDDTPGGGAKTRFRFGEGWVGYTAASREMLVIDDVRSDPRLRDDSSRRG
jgi:hypothetical protein